MLEKGTVINTVERYAEAVTKEFSPIAVILFGSYENGNPTEDSDIDVGNRTGYLSGMTKPTK